LTDLSCSASAYCQARRRLPLAVIVGLARHVATTVQQVCDCHGRWHGHRLWRIDGTGVSMPDTPSLRACFGQPSVQPRGCGFPVASLVVRTHAGTGMLMDLFIGPLVRHEMTSVPRMHEQLQAGDVLVADRGFCSYAHLGLVIQRGLHAVFRQHQRKKVSFKRGPGRRRDIPARQRGGRPNTQLVHVLGPEDQVVRYFKQASPRPRWMSPQSYDDLPSQIEVRELRYRVRQRGYRTRTVILVTTLTDAGRYPAEELAQVYFDRWQVEVDLRHLKVTLGMDVLHCRSVDGVLKEMWMFVLVYNLVRLVMLQSALHQGVPPDRVSFVDAYRHLRRYGLIDKVRDLMLNPDRPGRIEPRAIKRRMKKFPLMVKPREQLRQQLLNTTLAA
jgi:hypothetical protein